MNVTITLSIEELNLVLQGLGELPAKISMVLIQKIHDDASNQTKQPKHSEN